MEMATPERQNGHASPWTAPALDLAAGTRLQDPTFARNVVLLVMANAATVALIVRHYFPGKTSVIVTAGALTLVLASAVVLTWSHRKRLSSWAVLVLGLLVSRELVFLSTGIVFGVRDAGTHIFGQTLGILQGSHIPMGDTYTYFPGIHILLSTAKLFTGLEAWNAAAVLAPILALATCTLVVLTARALRPGSEFLVGVLFIAAPTAAVIGTLYQPMTVSVLFFAALAYLVARADELAFRRTLFVALGIVLTLVHPYSAATMDGALLLMAIADAVINRRRTFLAPAIAVFLFTFVYTGFVAGDLEFFTSLFRFNIFSPATTPEGSGTVFKPPRPIPPTWAYRIVNQVALLGVLVPAALGWILTLRERRGRPTSQHLLAVGLGALFALGLLFAFVLQSRVIALASIVLALYAAWGYARFPRNVTYAILPIVLLCALTSATATASYFPWSEGDQNLQPLQQQDEMGSLMGFYYGKVLTGHNDAKDVRVVSSDIIFHKDRFVGGLRPFTTMQEPGAPHADYFLWRDSADVFGYSLTASGGTLEAKLYTPYPTGEQHRMLVFTDRIAQFGEYQVYQA